MSELTVCTLKYLLENSAAVKYSGVWELSEGLWTLMQKDTEDIFTRIGIMR
jgi:hypothetical protein